MTLHQLYQISPHVHWLSPDSTTDRPVLGAISGERGTLLVDAGNSPAHAQTMLDALAARGVSEPIFLALTHWHWDHVFGAATVDLPTFAHHETARIVRAMADLDWSDAALDRRVADGIEIAFCRDMMKLELPDRSDLIIRPPEISFRTEVEIDLGGVTCQIIHVGGDHAHDASVVYIPQDKVLFLGDCVADDLYHGPRRCTTAALFPLLDRILAFDADFYLSGHSPDAQTRAQLAEEADLLKTIGRTVEETGPDRAAMLAKLPTVLGVPLDDDHIDIADAFIAGLRMPVVQSVL
jgi:glyoxylase-like metal-dependent hydrolase (beta-lactamase superfamily II)